MKKYLMMFLVIFLIIGGVAFVFMRPVPIAIERSTTINVPIEEVYAKVADLNEWKKWSPWLIAEPDAQVKVSGDGKKVGDIYSWNGELIGAGELEHMVVDPNKGLGMEIRFTSPFRSKSSVGFEFTKVEGETPGTKVIWTMHGHMPKAMKNIMQTMIGMDYDRGLAMLKALSEKGNIPSKVVIRGNTVVGPKKYLGIEFTCKIDEISEASGKAFDDLKAKLGELKIEVPSMLTSIYSGIDMKEGTFHVIAAAEVENIPDPLPTGMVKQDLKQHDAYQVDHIGSFDHIGNGWFVGMQNIMNNKDLVQSKEIKPYERYPRDWKGFQEADIPTKIYFPLK